jgi:hypothetical protein
MGEQLHQPASASTAAVFLSYAPQDAAAAPALPGRDAGIEVSGLKVRIDRSASADAKEKFAQDFVVAWNKVMNADRFDLS